MVYKIVLTSMGGTRRNYMTGLTEDEAIKLCEDNGWEIDPDGGYVWDMEIEEDD